ncbi:metalloregulator ArsR/SmtB family transcription factor [Maricaulis sp.]|uniref:ArsR/SmtB family transcription factor n=1 Tax=Maricaulis sp. TaxID=1486257 RepID=UPI00261761CF|nr:metalloregulator ArsR/SmtB family transcription factor [Maricaulis sp.]
MEKTTAIQALSALAHDRRLDVFRLLVAAEAPDPDKAGLTPSEIAAHLSLPAPTLSFYLKELSQAGLVEGERNGRSIRYRAKLDTLRGLAAFLLEDCCRGLPAQTGVQPLNTAQEIPS